MGAMKTRLFAWSHANKSKKGLRAIVVATSTEKWFLTFCVSRRIDVGGYEVGVGDRPGVFQALLNRLVATSAVLLLWFYSVVTAFLVPCPVCGALTYITSSILWLSFSSFGTYSMTKRKTSPRPFCHVATIYFQRISSDTERYHSFTVL